MAHSTSPPRSPGWRVLIDRVRTTLWPPTPPDHVPAPSLSPEQDRLRRLDRIRSLLEETRLSLMEEGWTSGAWFSVAEDQGSRRVGTMEAFGLLAPGSSVSGACLVGAMLRLVEDPDTAPSVSDAWGCVDELYEAVHERMGHESFPAGRIYPHDQRRARLRALTAWNDEPGRQLGDVVDVIDRAISRTMVAACLTPVR
jgi:hypothetical protein